MGKLSMIANASQSMLYDQARDRPICKQGHECVGWGVNGVTGAPTLFPIVHLTYDPNRPDKQFHHLVEPREVRATHVINPVWAKTDGM